MYGCVSAVELIVALCCCQVTHALCRSLHSAAEELKAQFLQGKKAGKKLSKKQQKALDKQLAALQEAEVDAAESGRRDSRATRFESHLKAAASSSSSSSSSSAASAALALYGGRKKSKLSLSDPSTDPELELGIVLSWVGLGWVGWP